MSDNQTAKPTILLVESDDDTRPIMKRNLVTLGYRVTVALDEEDALERTEGGRLQPDLILFNVVGISTEAALHSTRLIRRNADLDGSTPIIVMAEHFPHDMEGRNVQVGENEYVTYLEDAEQLHSLLIRLLPTDGK